MKMIVNGFLYVKDFGNMYNVIKKIILFVLIHRLNISGLILINKNLYLRKVCFSRIVGNFKYKELNIL